MGLEVFHPAVAGWFRSRFDAPTRPQAEAWPAVKSGRHVLVAAPTGSGKTLAAFLSALDDLVRQGVEGRLADETQVVYVSPLKALSNDIHANLEEPLAGIRAELGDRELPDVDIRTAVRTGDTPARERQLMARRPPHVLVTTPESLFILLTSDSGRRSLSTVRTVIVDEIHAVATDKRGAHLALSLERLEQLSEHELVRIGLSATQRPIQEVARFLLGTASVDADGEPRCTIVDAGHRRELDMGIELPRSPLSAVLANEEWGELHERLAELIEEHSTTLIFVNTRRLAERLARHLAERLGEDAVTSHHGSLSREKRLLAERRLKNGGLRALVATASLELGIDIGDVDLACQVGSTPAFSTLLQRVGRSGHGVGRVPKGRLFPLTRDQLVECAALLIGVRSGELEELVIPERALDVLAQQLVAMSAAEEWSEDELFEVVRRAWPYRNLERAEFDEVLAMLADGYTTRRGRRSAWLHLDTVGGLVRGRRGARLAAITSGGAIPETANYDVIAEPAGERVGNVDEDFAVETMAGDIFQLGNTSWRVLRVENGRVRVEDARGQPPNIPFWLGEAPSRSHELSAAVSRLRSDFEDRLTTDGGGQDACRRWLADEAGLPDAAAEQLTDYLATARAALGALPTQDTLILERFFDESGGTQLVVHSPFGSRLNRAWGLALRKRFCRKFNFELQAAATEDAIVLSLGATHSFPVEEVYDYLKPATVRHVLVQALLDAPMFTTRWRWNANRSLAVLRARGGRRVPPFLQRLQCDDLLAVVFPDQPACPENLAGEREVPDHPLVRETVKDCLEEAMDIDALELLLTSMGAGELRLLTAEPSEPSVLAAEILNARPYAFLDDAPLEERRTRAVQSRRWLDPETASDLGRLDPAAIETVCTEAWPSPRNADELHDALVVHGFLTESEGRAGGWLILFTELVAAGRAALLTRAEGVPLWVAAERLPQLRAALPEGFVLEPELAIPARVAAADWTAEKALVELVRGRLEALGPVTADELTESVGVSAGSIEVALAALESEGYALRGAFRGTVRDEWCDRRLLARMHRYTLSKLRREIEPVETADFLRFAIAWQRLEPADRFAGADGVAGALELLEGFEAPATAWEDELLPARVAKYDSTWLDAACLSGHFAWSRRSPPKSSGKVGGQGSGKTSSKTAARTPVRSTPIAFVARRRLSAWAAEESATVDGLGADARTVLDELERHGASFFEELQEGSGLLPARLEQALGELVAAGVATCDGFAGLRALLQPASRRPAYRSPRRRPSLSPPGVDRSGRWSRIRGTARPVDPTEAAEAVGRILLKRYGVVFRSLLEREAGLPPWRDLVRVYHRLEARGEIRGGRFVAGATGEQFALPEAVARLRALRRAPREDRLVSLSAADPLNLVGILTPGKRLPAVQGNRLLFRDGELIAVLEAGVVRFLVELEPEERWDAEKALKRGPSAPDEQWIARRREPAQAQSAFRFVGSD